MKNEKVYKLSEICEILNISDFTLNGWYRYEKKQLEEGLITEKYLPEPAKLYNEKGKPRIWTETMLKQLQEYKKNIVFGRNGIYGKYSNPNHKNTEKYKKEKENK